MSITLAQRRRAESAPCGYCGVQRGPCLPTCDSEECGWCEEVRADHRAHIIACPICARAESGQ